jgi:hypothetical protein
MRVVALALLVAVAAGCSMGGDEGSEATFEQRDLRRLVLLPRDLPQGFTQFDWGPQIAADSPAGKRADRERFGRIDGWKARYKRVGGTAQTRGAHVIESRAELFESSSGADDELDAHRAEVEDTQQLLDTEELGEESFASTSETGGQGTVVYYQFAWRVDNVTLSLLVSGFAGRLTVSDALALARRQERRTAPNAA